MFLLVVFFSNRHRIRKQRLNTCMFPIAAKASKNAIIYKFVPTLFSMHNQQSNNKLLMCGAFRRNAFTIYRRT